MMTGAGEWQFVLFALALGLGEIESGLVATVPMFIGARRPVDHAMGGTRRVGSLRRWTWICAALQSLSMVPLVVAALLARCPGGFSFWCSGATGRPAT